MTRNGSDEEKETDETCAVLYLVWRLGRMSIALSEDA